MRYRQIHLDFHTSEHIPGIGSRFDADKFGDAFKAADVDSVTVFSRPGPSSTPIATRPSPPG
jgi:hypothetical protein